MSEKKNAVVPNRPREVGVLTNGRLYMPLPTDLETFQAMRGNAHSLAGMIASYDLYALHAAALSADRTIVHDVDGEREARDESRTMRRHDREISALYRKKEKLEAELEVELIEQALEAKRRMKDKKFAIGEARLDQRHADAELAASVTREGLRPEPREEIFEPARKPPSRAKILSGLIDDAQEALDAAVADGRPADGLRGELEALRAALHRTIREEV